jgi:hypothetical protein
MEFKKIIKDKGLTQKHVANKIDEKESYLSLCLNGKRPMPESIKEKLTLFLINH